jgi:hypothetical protein
MSINRINKDKKLLMDLNKEKEKLYNIKIEDKRMTKELDVSIITSKTLEGLLNYI